MHKELFSLVSQSVSTLYMQGQHENTIATLETSSVINLSKRYQARTLQNGQLSSFFFVQSNSTLIQTPIVVLTWSLQSAVLHPVASSQLERNYTKQCTYRQCTEALHCHDHPPAMVPMTCMKTSTKSEMHHSWVMKSKSCSVWQYLQGSDLSG